MNCLGADFIGYDAPPAIVGKPGQTVTVPIFVSHFSDRQGPVKLRWWVSGYDSRADIRTVAMPTRCPDHVAAVRRGRPRTAQDHSARLSVRRGPSLDAPR